MTPQEIIDKKNQITIYRIEYVNLILDKDIEYEDLPDARNIIANKAKVIRDELEACGNQYVDSLYMTEISDNINKLRSSIIKDISPSNHVKDMEYWNRRLSLYGINDITEVEVNNSIAANNPPITNDVKGVVTDRQLSINQFYRSFTGSDAIVSLVFPDNTPIVLGQAQTLSYSIYRKKLPIQTLGRISPRGFVKGSRVVAGTVIFNSMDNHWTNEVRLAYPNLFDGIGKIKADELPPFDILITMANEYGSSSYYIIYSASVIEEGQVVSTEDPMMQNLCQFVARDIDIVERWTSDNSISGTSRYRKPDYDIAGTFKVSYATDDTSLGAPLGATDITWNSYSFSGTEARNTSASNVKTLPTKNIVNEPIQDSKYIVPIKILDRVGTENLPLDYTVRYKIYATWNNSSVGLGDNVTDRLIKEGTTGDGDVSPLEVDVFSDGSIDNGTVKKPDVKLKRVLEKVSVDIETTSLPGRLYNINENIKNNNTWTIIVKKV